MTTNNTSTLTLGALLLTGIAIGIVSQRFPETKSYTDQMIRPIENSSLFKKLKVKMGYKDTVVHANEPYTPSIHTSQAENSHPGQPLSSFIIHRKEYSLAYDARHHNPIWVYEHLTAEDTLKDKAAIHSSFKEDENIPQHLRSNLNDYKTRSLDHVQMASTANHQSNVETMNETFYLTNLCPQCPQLHQDYWPKLEEHVKNLTKTYAHVYAITGPLYLPYNEKEGRFIKYRVIGTNDVAVPSHFFKVLILEDKQGKKESLSYILPNHEIPLTTPLDEFKTSLQQVEKAAGIIFQ